MNKNDFLNALEILSSNHSTKLVINKAINGFVGTLGKDKWTIHITECCASVIDKLKNEGYRLSMSKYGLDVDKY